MRFPYVVLLSACALMWTATLLAQSPNGVINGLVVDPSSGAIVGADVVIVNDVTGVRYITKTNGEGIYVLPSLPPGPYRLQVSKIGFKTIIKPDIVLNLQDALSINFTLPIGASYETVTVEGGASMVNTADASVSTVVDQSYIKNMPLNGRSFQDLILLTPGVVTQTPQVQAATTGLGLTGEFSVNGQRPESNYYTVDGASANVGATIGIQMFRGAGASGSLPGATALGTTQALVSVDDLEEFRVQSSTYSAAYGRNPGGQFSFETKSGTNLWHGTAYDYLRNGVFDAQDWFNNYFGESEPALRQNDYGGTLGGPVEFRRLYRGQDKTFFFLSYEGLRLIAPQAATVNYVPDIDLRESAASPLNAVLNAFPAPNGPPGSDSTANGIAEFIGTWSNPSSINSTSVRFDHVITDRLKLFFRFSDTGSSSATRGTYAIGSTPTSNVISAFTMRTYTAGLSSVLSSHHSNEFRVNSSSNRTTYKSLIDGFGGSTAINLTQLEGAPAGSGSSVFLLYGGYEIVLPLTAQSGAQRQWNLVDTVSLALGRHQFKFGADYRRLAPTAVPPALAAVFYYQSKSGVEENSGFAYGVKDAPAYPLYMNFSAFAQDEWRLSRVVTLSTGMRWEVNPAPGVTHGLNGYTIQGSGPSTWGLAPQGTPLWHTTYGNFAPRLGAAFNVRNRLGWETVIRSGGGVFFDTGQQLGSLSFFGPGFSASSGFVTGGFPVLPPIPPIVNPPVGSQLIVYGFSPHMQLPYTLQWNASLEQDLGKSQSLTVSYVGSHASRLLQEYEVEATINPNAEAFFIVQNGLTSDYDALQTQFRRRLSRGLTALASYTWSHCLDYGSQNYLFGYVHGNCDFDVRHAVSSAFSYNPPEIAHGNFLNATLRHWGFDDRFTARTAFPVTLNGNETVDHDTGQVLFTGLNLVPNEPLYLYGANCAATYNNGRGCPGGRAINPNAFTNVNSGFGDAPRGFARGFAAVQMDLAVRREFPIRERLKLQFRAEAFNVFNHPNFGTISSEFGISTFGQATGTLASSLGVLNPLYQMGGPRSMQFALKLIF